MYAIRIPNSIGLGLLNLTCDLILHYHPRPQNDVSFLYVKVLEILSIFQVVLRNISLDIILAFFLPMTLTWQYIPVDIIL